MAWPDTAVPRRRCSIVVLSFLVIRLAPGSPFSAERAGPPEVLRDLEAHYGFDRPVWVQLGRYLGNLARRDLAAIRHLADRVAVMYLGQIVEMGATEELLRRPRHPYTQALLSAVPVPDPAQERLRQPIMLEGEVASVLSPPTGCRFRTRCFRVFDRCGEPPAAHVVGPGHLAACHLCEADAARP